MSVCLLGKKRQIISAFRVRHLLYCLTLLHKCLWVICLEQNILLLPQPVPKSRACKEPTACVFYSQFCSSGTDVPKSLFKIYTEVFPGTKTWLKYPMSCGCDIFLLVPHCFDLRIKDFAKKYATFIGGKKMLEGTAFCFRFCHALPCLQESGLSWKIRPIMC